MSLFPKMQKELPLKAIKDKCVHFIMPNVRHIVTLKD